MTQEELKQILDYDPDTGLFRWKIKPCKNVDIGDIAGTNRDGYIVIGVNRKQYRAHRLAWLYMTGSWPLNQIDHINRIKNDNRISNLREATQQKNNFNLGGAKNNTSGYKGVTWYEPSKKWKAQIGVNGKNIHLGYFIDPLEASEAYQKAKEKYHVI